MATQTRKNKKIIAWICGVIVAIALVVVAIVAVIMSSNRISESFFVSDGTKYVVKLGAENNMLDFNIDGYLPEKFYLVYFYSGDRVTDVKAYYKYEDDNAAREALNYFNSQKEENADVTKFEINGAYVIAVLDKSLYENMTAEDAKQQVEFMEILEKMNSSSSEE